MLLHKVNSVQEACAKCFSVHIANHTKIQNKKPQNARSIGEKLKTKSLMFFVSFSCDFQDVNCKAFGARKKHCTSKVMLN